MAHFMRGRFFRGSPIGRFMVKALFGSNILRLIQEFLDSLPRRRGTISIDTTDDHYAPDTGVP
jgi:hypothetical protein